MPIMSFQGQGGTAIPYMRSATLSTISLAATNAIDSVRLRRYDEALRFFQGNQWSFVREGGEPLVTANYTRAIVLKRATWLMGGGMTLTVPETLRDITQPDLEEVWRYNGEQEKLNELGLSGGLHGDAFIIPQYEAPTDLDRRLNPYSEGKIKIRIVPPHQCFPRWDPLDRDTIISLRVITEISDAEFDRPRSTFLTAFPSVPDQWVRRRRFVEEITADQIARGWEGAVPNIEQNILEELPVVHIKNEVFPGEFYGISNVDGLIDLQRELNEKLTDVSDMVNYHANPVTVITGATARNLEKGPKALWSVKDPSAKVFNLAPVSDLGAGKAYAESVKSMMFDTAGVPEGSLGHIQQISNTSAAALRVQFGPLIEATERVAPNYERGIERTNYFILRYIETIRNRLYPRDICSECGGKVAERRLPNGTLVRGCFHLDKSSYGFLDPYDFVVNWRREMSFGTDVVRMKFRDVKRLMSGDTPKPSFWDPQPDAIDEEERVQEENDEAQRNHEQAEAKKQAEQPETAEPPQTDPETGEEIPSPPKPKAAPPKPPPVPKKPKLKVPQLAENEVDLPAEPISSEGWFTRQWDEAQRRVVLVPVDAKLIIPMDCQRSTPVSPYTNKVKLNTSLPRDLADETNLYASWLNSKLVSRAEVRRRLPIRTSGAQLDNEILDDIATDGKAAAAAAGGKEQKADNGGKQGQAVAAKGVNQTNSTPATAEEKEQPEG